MNDATEFKIPIGMIVIAVLMILGYGAMFAGPEGAAILLIATLIYLAIALVAGVVFFMLIGMIAQTNFGTFPRALLKLTAIILLTSAIMLLVGQFVGCSGLILVVGLYWTFCNWLFQYEGKEGLVPAIGLVISQTIAFITLPAILGALL